MPKEYPDSITWMIEVRDWPDGEDQTAAENAEKRHWTHYVPPEPISFGTGVVIRLEQLTLEDKPMSSPVIRNFLLTCGHVVRVGENGFGRIAKEIVCWHPDYGYLRTKRGHVGKNEGRLKNQIIVGHKGSVSALSPYDGRHNAIPDDEQAKHLDWVLLEVANVEGRPKFDTDEALKTVARPESGEETIVYGYPGGAGWVKMASQWLAGAHLIPDGGSLQAVPSEKHVVDRVSNEIIGYLGRVDARPGMSGGGGFRASDWALVGLHRSRDDAALRAGAVCMADILEWLRTNRHMRPVFRPSDAGGNKPGWLEWLETRCKKAAALEWLKTRWKKVAAGALSIALALLLWPKPTYYWEGRVIDRASGEPIAGVVVTPFAGNLEYDKLQTTTDNDGLFEIKTKDSGFNTGTVMLILKRPGSNTGQHAEQQALDQPGSKITFRLD